MAVVDLGEPFAAWPQRPIGTVRVTSRDDQPVFIGVGPARQVRGWLKGSAYERVIAVNYGPFRTDQRQVIGREQLEPPTSQTFWVASATGPGAQTITWPSAPGEWMFVVANADGQPVVATDLSMGIKADLLSPALIAGAIGLLLLVMGAAIMVLVLGPASVADAAAPAALAGSYPARLDAVLDSPLSRGMWLVKWLLALPHVFVLALLWLAVLPLTIVAGFAILFTGRYPRRIFNFNVGVLRWMWRVSYYAFNVLGTDRYPPFSLRPQADYPADFTVEYPERLSRGLVLVKWWLLAIPHYLIVAIFASGAIGFDGRNSGGLGLIGILVLVAVIILLFSGRYPRSLYDFVMGLNRWCYRVLAYVLLMRDEYPPFRLDQGGADPGAHK